MNRLDKALYLVNREGFGLEIGPSLNPIAPKKMGFNVEIVDHTTAEELRKKYQSHPKRVENIEAVDYVWQGEQLTELIGKQNSYDYVIASHVIEHVPDVVSFLVQCEMLLKPDGVLSLIIPDKRYCFDYFRWPSSIGEILQAYTDKRIRHSPGAVFDYFSNVVRMDGAHIWGQETEIGNFSYINSLERAKHLWRSAQNNDEYIDIHSWRFTPFSFKLILHDLNSLGLTQLTERCSFVTTGCEFYITLGKSKASGLVVNRLQLANEAMKELLVTLDSKEKIPLKASTIMNQKVLFIHVAKAAGSSINRFFIERYTAGKSIVHVEGQKDVFKDKTIIEDKDFISGHITYREFKSRLHIERFFVIACLREPITHVISHLAWIRKLAEPSEKHRFDAHPPYIQKLASKMLDVDFSSPLKVQALIENLEPIERRLLDNVQVNYLHEHHCNSLVGQTELKSALAVVNKLDLIGIVEHMDLFFQVLSLRLGMLPTFNVLRENIQTEKYGMNPDDLEFQAAVEPLIRYDRILYRDVKEKFLSLIAKEEIQKKQPPINEICTIKGNVDQVSPQLIHGWCMRLDTMLPAQLALYINNEEIAITEATLPRPDVHLRGIHPTGLCGFRFTPGDQFVLHTGDVVSVKVIGRDYPLELRNSPKICA